MNQMASTRRTQVIAAPVEGTSINATRRMTGVAKPTILKLLIYAEAVENAFGSQIDYAMLVKLYGSSGDSPESRYSPASCIGCSTGVLSGNPDPNHISTSYVERSNLSMRMGMRRFTRLTQPFSAEVWRITATMLALYFHALQLYSDS